MPAPRSRRLLRRDLGVLLLFLGVALTLSPLVGQARWQLHDPYGDTRRVLACCGVALAIAGLLNAIDARRIWSAQVVPPRYSGATLIGLSVALLACAWRLSAFKQTIYLSATCLLAALILLCGAAVRIAQRRRRG